MADLADNDSNAIAVVRPVALGAVRKFNNGSDLGFLSPKRRFATELKLGDKKR
jgi:hypothetical protein